MIFEVMAVLRPVINDEMYGISQPETILIHPTVIAAVDYEKARQSFLLANADTLASQDQERLEILSRPFCQC